MRLYRKRQKLQIVRKRSDLIVERVTAALCFELDFKGVDYELCN